MDRRAGRAPFDVVVLDERMPGVDGSSACRVLRETNRHAPVLFVTSEGEPGSCAVGRRASGDLCLVKPFSASGLRAALQALTGLRREEAH